MGIRPEGSRIPAGLQDFNYARGKRYGLLYRRISLYLA